MKKKKDKKVDIDDFFDRNQYGFDEIINKQPKFNLKKIDAKEVLDLLNSGDKEDRKKAISCLYKVYKNRYLEIAKIIEEKRYPSDPHAFIWESYRQVKGDTQS